LGYSLQIGLRYLRSKKRSTISVITTIAVTGVALGVAALLAVLSITSGFQKDFRDKVLGVNAHVLVLKYGLDFDEYRDVIERAERMPEVEGAAPFLINEMMLAKGDRLSGVLVKGIDPDRMPEVLDLPDQMIAGSLEGMRAPGAVPPRDPDELQADSPEDDLDAMLRELSREGDARGRPDGGAPGPTDELDERTEEALRERIARDPTAPVFRTESELDALAEGPPDPEAKPDELAEEDSGGRTGSALPDVDVPSPEEVEAALAELEDGPALPDDAWEQELVERERSRDQDERPTDGLPGLVLGVTLAENLGIEVGDRVKVVSPLTGLDVSMWAPEARTPRSRDFQVTGIFQAGFQEYDSRLVYVDLYEAQRFYESGDSVTGVEMRLSDLEKSREVARRLEQELAGPFHTMDWAELNHNLFTALEIQKAMLSLVIASIILVAAFNVIATLIMIVLEKKREIAILKAMGAADRSILGIFLVQGSIIGVVGTLIGLLLGGAVVGYLAAYEFPLDPKVYLIDRLPVVVSPVEFLLTAVIALLICTTATLIPSWWAARLLPAEGVRYE
jgi:lipoprotein-releasing system permease protein